MIGGGPVGGYTADLIAKAGYSVAVLEEHENIGEPVQCAGLVTPRVFDMIGHARPSIVNEVKGAYVYSPSGRKITIEGGATKAMVIDRHRFDMKIIQSAEDHGAEVFRGSKVKGIERIRGTWTVNSRETVDGRLLIGADGAGSSARRWLGMEEPKFMLTGVDAEVSGIDIDQDKVNVFVGEETAPNFFAWIIPAGDKTRVGLCTRDSVKPLTHYFDRLFGNGPSGEILNGSKVMTHSSGRIPLGILRKTHAEGAMLVGDAASQVKATTGGGIYMGLVCACHCARKAIEALEKGDTSESTMAGYDQTWMDDVGGELRKCLMLHRILASTTDRDMEVLFDIFADEKILKLTTEVGDIDYPSKLAWALLKKEPRLIKYAGRYLKQLMRRG